MSASNLHPLARDYLERLAHHGQRLGPAARRELLADLGAHLRETTQPSMLDAEVLTVLDRLGDPEEIIAAEAPEAPPDTTRRGVHEWAAIILLLVGGFVAGIGWIVGLVLLWTSSAWRVKDKLIGTLLVPGGLAGAFAVLLLGGSSHSCSGQAIQVVTGGVGPATPAHPTGTPLGTSTGTQTIGSNLAHSVSCSGGTSTVGHILGIAGLVVLLIIPILTAIYLARRAAAGRGMRF